jgi:hypothetical protein
MFYKTSNYYYHICTPTKFDYNKQVGLSSKSTKIKQFIEQHWNNDNIHSFLEVSQAGELRARSISSNDRPFVSTTLLAMYRTARTHTAENPKYTELIPNLFITLKK